MSGTLSLRLALQRPDFGLSVELELPGRGVSVLFGPSGSGKTTLLRCVAGLEPQARGLVRIGAETWQDDAAGLRLPTWRRDLGYVFQEASLFEHLDVRRNLEFGLHVIKIQRREQPPRPKLEDIRQRLENDWRSAAVQKAEEDNLNSLLKGYDVVIERPK